MKVKEKDQLRDTLAMILGLPIPKGRIVLQDRIITFKVPKNRILRPAFNPDPNTDKVASTENFVYVKDFTYTVNSTSYTGSCGYCVWFANKSKETFLDTEKSEITNTHYPFTGLGYTYDWRKSAKEPNYGLSEFIVIPNTDITIVESMPLVDYYDRLKGKPVKVKEKPRKMKESLPQMAPQ